MVPLYEKARLGLACDIRQGRYPVDSLLPAVEVLASRLGCSVETTRRALRALSSEGVVRGIQRRGTVVLRRPRARRVCLVLADDTHSNGLLQQPLAAALAVAELELRTVVPEPDFSETLARVGELLAGAQPPDCLLMLVPESWPAAARVALARVARGFARGASFMHEPYLEPIPGAGLQVGVDARVEAQLAMAHLLSLGHRRITVFAGYGPAPRPDLSGSVFAAACADELAAAGATFLPYDGTTGIAGLLHLVRAEKATALVHLNDHLAMGALMSLLHAGVKVPEEVSVMGRHDTPWCKHTVPPLSSLSINPAGVAAALVRALTEPAVAGPVLVRPLLVARGSTSPAPARHH